MRKKISLFLASALLFTSIQVTDVRAETQSIRLYEATNGLGYSDNRICEAPLGNDEASIKIPLNEDGEYKLDYYIEVSEANVLKTYKVNLNFLKDTEYLDGEDRYQTKGDNIAVKVQLNDSEDKAVPLVYSTHDYPYIGKWSSRKESTQFVGNLKIGNADLMQDKAMGIKVGPYAHLKLYYDSKTNEINIVTNKINIGNLSDFKLYHNLKSIQQDAKPDSTITIFKGLSGFRIDPTHLYNDNGELKSLINVDNKSILTGGSPGMRVRFERPKKIVDNKFVYTTDSDKLTAILKLNEEFRGDNAVNSGYQILLNFGLSDKALIKNGLPFENRESDGSVIAETINNKEYITTYYAKDKIDERVYNWGYLSDGMIIDGSIEIAGSLVDNMIKKAYDPSNTGHTYISYGASRLGVDDIVFKIKPYRINGAVTYKLQKSIDPNAKDDNWTTVDTRHYSEYVDGDITLTTNSKTSSYYRLLIETYGKADIDKSIRSQVIMYTPEGELIPIHPTEIVGVNNIRVIPNEINTDAESIKFDMTWTAPDNNELLEIVNSGDKLYYELYLHGTDGLVTPIKIFEATPNKDSVSINTYAGTSSNGEYNKATNTFTVKDITLKGNEQWERLDIPKDYLDRGKTDYPTVGDNGIKVYEDMKYSVPNSYGLSMVVIRDNSGDKELIKSNVSHTKAIALDFNSAVIETPTVIYHTSTYTNGKSDVTIGFNNIDLVKYTEIMLNPIKASLNNSYERTYEVYLYTDKNMASWKLEKEENVKTLEFKEDGIEVDNEYLGNSGKAYKVDVISDKNKGDSLVKFKGLDGNKNYYVQIRVKINPVKDDGTVLNSRYSIMSKIYTFITDSSTLPPSLEELVPTTPIGFNATLVNGKEVVLTWDKHPTDTEVDQTFYEIIRTESNKLKDEYLDKNIGIESIVGKENSYKAFRNNEEYITTYSNNSWQNLGNYVSLDRMFVDNYVDPNTVYYYYVRTVNIVNNQEIRSAWIYKTITTNPIGKPINLKVESSDKYSYDTYHSTALSFLAPIDKDGKIPDEYDFEVWVRGEEDEDFTNKYTSSLIALDTEKAGSSYRFIVYRVDGLEQGKRYDVKVRIVDKTKTINNGEYSKSLYSDIVTFRTESNAEEVEQNNKYDEYLKRYDSETDRLRYQPYWKLDNGIFKYRESYLDSVIISGNTSDLIVDSTNMTYYIPIEMAYKLQDKDSLIRVNLKNTEVVFRQNFLTPIQKEIVNANRAIKGKKYSGYYIGLYVSENDKKVVIEGSKNVSPEISLGMDIVYTSKTDDDLEKNILEALNDLIKTGRDEFITELDKYIIKQGVVDSDILDKIIQDKIAEIEEQHQLKATKIVKQYSKGSENIDSSEAPILISSIIKSDIVKAYSFMNNKWNSISSFKSADKYIIETVKLGKYIFTGNDSLSVSPELNGLTDFIGKYNLGTIFNLDGNKVKVAATKGQLYNAIAVILGADRSLDGGKYLVQYGIKGIHVNLIEAPIKQDESIYIIMQVYEKVHNSNLKALQIQNKLIVSNINQFQKPHILYVYGAVKLGIVKTTQNSLNPKANVSQIDLIKMMSKALY